MTIPASIINKQKFAVNDKLFARNFSTIDQYSSFEIDQQSSVRDKVSVASTKGIKFNSLIHGGSHY